MSMTDHYLKAPLFIRQPVNDPSLLLQQANRKATAFS